MSLEGALTSWLKAQAGISALVGTRVYPQKREQGSAVPAIAYQRISGSTKKHLTGLAGVAKSTLQIDCFGNTLADAEALALAVRGTQGATSLDTFRGAITYTDDSNNSVTVRVQSAKLVDNQEAYERPVHGDDVGVPHVPLVFDFWYEES